MQRRLGFLGCASLVFALLPSVDLKEHEKQVGDGNEIQLVPQVKAVEYDSSGHHSIRFLLSDWKVQAVFCPVPALRELQSG